MWILKSIKTLWTHKLYVLYSLPKPLEPLIQGSRPSLITVSSPLDNGLEVVYRFQDTLISLSIYTIQVSADSSLSGKSDQGRS
jgi:hypothetical protein